MASPMVSRYSRASTVSSWMSLMTTVSPRSSMRQVVDSRRNGKRMPLLSGVFGGSRMRDDRISSSSLRFTITTDEPV